MGVRPGLAKAGDRAIDQAWIDRRQAGEIQAIFFQASDLEVLDHDIARSGQVTDGLGPFRAGHVQGDRLLAPVGTEEIGRVAARPFMGGGKGRAPQAGVVAGARTLDLDHLGPQVCQGLGRPGSSQDTGQVKNADA